MLPKYIFRVKSTKLTQLAVGTELGGTSHFWSRGGRHALIILQLPTLFRAPCFHCFGAYDIVRLSGFVISGERWANTRWVVFALGYLTRATEGATRAFDPGVNTAVETVRSRRRGGGTPEGICRGTRRRRRRAPKSTRYYDNLYISVRDTISTRVVNPRMMAPRRRYVHLVRTRPSSYFFVLILRRGRSARPDLWLAERTRRTACSSRPLIGSELSRRIVRRRNVWIISLFRIALQ